jgi:hypothetical protein
VLTLSQRTILLAVTAALVGCGAAPKVPFQADVKQRIKTIAIAQTPDPERYFLNPGANPAGAALYIFGAIGGAILGGIEAARAESATKELMTSFGDELPAVGSLLTDDLKSALAARGYEITQVPAMPKAKEEDAIDCGANKNKFDAVMQTSISAGYVVESQVEPRVMLRVRLFSSDCGKLLFSDTFLYGNKEVRNATLLTRNEDAAFPSREQLIANPARAREALRTGTKELAKRAAQEL